MTIPRPAPLSRRRVLLGLPATLIATTLMTRPALASAKPKVFECAADLMKVS